ncbi:hypothetical protein LV457_08380 [Mycobacterium sp. MYCO198283]|uniref:hypothetical protein n=1 Tax=Mycobacterium sp. MYCO198283 TaxID=2883505 RepID=UPI001E3D517F|nr:hypothetical protein [Mycobacterium sp. MYCO198283]MCG5432309.1 hypothetical protein [Mycobacterium sp. MYCO198283]
MTLFLFRLIPPRADFAQTMTDDEQAAMDAHMAYWQQESGRHRRRRSQRHRRRQHLRGARDPGRHHGSGFRLKRAERNATARFGPNFRRGVTFGGGSCR